MASSAPEAPKRGLHRTVTGSQMDLTEMETLIHSASMRGQNTEASSVASSSQTGRSNIIQIQPGKKNIKAAIKAALAEAQGYDDPDEPPVRPLEDMTLDDDDDEDAAYGMSSPSTPSKRRPSVDLKPDVLRAHATEPLQGAGTAYRTYSESSAPPEGAGGFSAGQFIPPVITEQKPPSQKRHEPLGHGLHRTITGSSLKLSELNNAIEKAGEQECPKTPSSHGGRTPRSTSGLSLNSRSSSIVQIQPGMKDIRTALANAIASGEEQYTDSSPTEGGMSERQGLGGSQTGSFGGGTTPGGGGVNAFGSISGPMHRPRSIRRLMSEKSFNMDTVYSGMIMDSDLPNLPSEPLEGTGVVSGRKYVEPKHGPQYNADAPKDFPRVVNGVPTTGSGDYEAGDPRGSIGSIPPSPSATTGGLKKSGVHRTISGSQMDLAEYGAMLEKASVPKSGRSSFDCARSSTGGGSITRTIKGSGLGSSHGSQVFGEELEDKPTGTFGHRACSISEQDIQEMIQKASVPRSVSAVSERSEPDSPRSTSSGAEPGPSVFAEKA